MTRGRKVQQPLPHPGSSGVWRWVYEWRVAADRSVVLLAFISWGGWVAFLAWQGRHGEVPPALVVESMELVLPLLAAALTAAVTARDWEEGTLSWRLSLPGGALRLLVRRLAVAGMVWVVTAAAWAATAAARWRPAGLAAGAAIPVAWNLRALSVLLIPPALWLSSLSLAATLWGRASLWGIMAASAFWLADLASGGRLVAPLCVLYLSGDPPSLDYPTNRWWLVGGAATVAILTFRIFRREERWLR